MLGGLNNLYRMSLLLTADIRGFTTGLERAESRLLAFSSKANRFGQSINRGVGLAFAFVGAASVKAAADFNRADTILGQIVGRTSLDPLTKQAKELGRSSIFLATEASAAQLELAKLGFQAGEVNKVLDRSVRLATVFGSDLDKTGRTVASTLRQFGLTLRGDEGLENVTKVTDIMAAAFKNSALDLTKFRESMKNVGPTARATGLDLVETTALLAVLANNAVDGSLGGTKLRSTLSDLAKQFPDVKEALKDLENGTLTYAELVELLNKRAALVGAIFQNNGREIRSFERILRNASGTLDEMTEGIEDNLFFQVERLSNAFRAVGIELGDALTPVVIALADAFEGLASALEQVDEKRLQEIVTAITSLAALAGVTQLLGFFGITLGRISQAAGAFELALVKSGTASANLVRGVTGAAGAVLALASAMGAIMELTLGGEVLGVRFGKAYESAADKAAQLAQERADRIQEIQDNQQALIDSDPFGLEELQQATGNFTLEEVNKDLEFYGEKLIEAQRSMDALLNTVDASESGLVAYGDNVNEVAEQLQALNEENAVQGEHFKKTEDYIKDLQFIITLLGRQAAALQAVNNAATGGGTMSPEALAKSQKEVLEQIAKDQEKLAKKLTDSNQEAPTVFGQSFMFDELSASEQMIALLSGEGIATANEFANSLEAIEMPEENFIDPELDKQLQPLVDAFVKIQGGMEGVAVFAQGFANSLGQAFLQATSSSQTFFESFKNSFLQAFKAVIAKLITLIALYTILAVVSGGTSMAAGGSFQSGFKMFTNNNSLGDFLTEGFGVNSPTGRSTTISGGDGNEGGVKVAGAVSGNNLVIMNQRGVHAYDRTFG